ncbi:MAG: S9 family peptidase [Acidobacteriaceae bacterium]|nr:S9 family peptidase [Acidobacteriaceae bacterium]
MSLRPAILLLITLPLLGEKRPLTHADYDSWKHIQNQQLSNDGRYLAYALFPQQGNGVLVIRDLQTGKEIKQGIGQQPAPPRPNYAVPQTAEDPVPQPPGVAIRFTPDNNAVVFSTFATYEAVETAKRAKKKPEEMPRGDVVVVKLPGGEVFRASSVKNFQLPSEASRYVAYLHSEPPKAERKSAETKPEPDPSDPTKSSKIESGELVLRDIGGGVERKFASVNEYLLSNDGQLLIYSVFSPGSQTNGVYFLHPRDSGEPLALFSGKGKFEKLAWDEDQTRLAFLSDTSAGNEPATFRVFTWDRRSKAAAEVASPGSPGFRSGWVISESAPVTVSKGGAHIFFGTGPQPAAPKLPDQTPADERVSVDLWSWKDDYIQPMQKVRASAERTRSYGAVYDIETKTFVQLADASMPELLPSEDGRFAAGGDDRAYRRMQEYDERYEDSYLVDTATGARKLIAPKHAGRTIWSPDSTHAIYYDGKDWFSFSAPDGKLVNLTAKLGVSFGREEYDAPGPAPSYGSGGWTKDGQYVLLNDRYDIWRVKPDGSSAEKLTDGRKEKIAFRVVRRETSEPEDKWIDPAKPLLLRAENDQTHASGFYRANLDGANPPVQLIIEPKNFAPAIKARNADVYVTAASTFSEYPDLLVTDGSFKKFEKVTNANPQLADLLWGAAELIHYTNADGRLLEGILYKPANFDPKKKYPMLVYIYERLSQNLNNFVEPKPTNVISPSYYASNGYLVLEPDIVYTIGYPGESALKCVLPAVQSIVNRGFVDEKAIGIQGHSWGGYQIAYMVTRTNRFRAAAPGAPVADMISAYDGIRWGPGIPRQFQYEHTQSRIGGTIWEYPLRYIENSPIFSIDRIQTPLLMIHNDADDAVPWYQGIEYYLALRRLKKEVYMFSYNGEPHNLRRRANQKDYTVRLQQFFDYYLKGAPKPEWMENGIPFLEKQGAISADGQP